MPSKFLPPRFLFLVVLFALPACGRYEPILWREMPGRIGSVSGMGKKMVSALEIEAEKKRARLFPQRTGGPVVGNENPSAVSLKLIVAGFPEARSGLRTKFSEKIENAIRSALEKSRMFEIVDGGEGISWQEAGMGVAATAPPGERGAPGRAGKKAVAPRGAARTKRGSEWGDDHPLYGIWPRIRGGRYGERSVVHAASMLGAEAAVYGAYAKRGGRILVWAAVVLDRPPRRLFFKRELKDAFGLPDRLKVSRPYLGYARVKLPRKWVPDAWLAAKVPPRPRARPRHSRYWAKPAFEVVLEKIDSEGARVRLSGGEIIGSKALIVGRIGVIVPRYVYGFALDRYGRAEPIFFSGQKNAKPALVRPGHMVHFSARLLPPGRGYRIYFVSSESDFDAKKVVDKASIRLGIREGKISAARSFREAAKGAPQRAWFVPPGQEGIILENHWDQHVYWFFRKNSG